VADEDAIGERFRALAGELDERRRRVWAAAEARACGRGGIAAVARATGISEATIRKGLRELDAGERLAPGRVRRPGGGRKRVADAG
jgi:DNA-binding MurR/RpiR family transcriptional regulator